MDKILKFSNHCLQRYQHDAFTSLIASHQKKEKNIYCQQIKIVTFSPNFYKCFDITFNPNWLKTFMEACLLIWRQSYYESQYIKILYTT